MRQLQQYNKSIYGLIRFAHKAVYDVTYWIIRVQKQFGNTEGKSTK